VVKSPVGAERIAGRVIIAVAGLHIGFDADRPLGAKPLQERAGEGCQATLSLPGEAFHP
jgi:hypothetical protein